jgi:nitrite reductase (NADH) large subunit
LPSRRLAATWPPGLKKLHTRGTSCGSCVPLLKQLLEAEGVEQSKALCEHFSSRELELFEIVSGQRRSGPSPALIEPRFGSGKGCDICKPAVASILASTGSEHIPRRRAGLAAGHQRPLPGQHPAERQYSMVPRGARR